jgi:phosphopantothenoylcysteine decarboxylase/phosphopantothenate--cysteine ligase
MAAKRVILGVGGGIAAYKSAELTRLLVQAGLEVQPVMTQAATEFITPLTLASLANKKVITGLFAPAQDSEATLSSAIEHINVALENDLLLVAPATAGLLGKFANGLADDFLSTLYLAFTGPVLLAPAMNTNMWASPAVQRNAKQLAADRVRFVGPGSGDLACGMVGPGRMAEPSEIAAAALSILNIKRDLTGKTVLLTAGPTEEPIDPVRVITNRSSGKMGYALAEAAADRGARVILVSGPVALSTPSGVERTNVRTASEMLNAVISRVSEADIFIGVAAVADYTPTNSASDKIKKSVGELSITLQPTTDILATVGAQKGSRLVVGFAAETSNLAAEAQRKLAAKNCDLLVANLVDAQASVFGSDSNQVTIYTRDGRAIPHGPAPKSEIAHRILDEIAFLL